MTATVDLDELLKIALTCAQDAAEILLDGQQNGFGTIDTKSTASDIVTEIDKRSETSIVSTLRTLRPDDAILGEEGTDDTGTSGVRWVIDPLDGTVNYTYGIPSYAVCIGAEVDGEPSVGVVLNPATNEIFSAVTGSGATLNGRTIQCNTETTLAQTLLATGFSYDSGHRQNESHNLTRVLPAVRDIRRSGSAALDLCDVACGRVDAYFEHVVKPWDVVAASVIAREAGATVTGFTDNQPSYDVVAANPSLHSKLRSLVVF